MFSIRHRVAAATGALYVVFIIIGNTLATANDSSSSHPTGAAVLRDVERQAHSGAATAGFVLEVVGFTLFIVFLGYLAATFAARSATDDGGRVLGATAVVSGVTMLAIKLGSAAPMVALFMDRQQVDRDRAQAAAHHDPPVARRSRDALGRCRGLRAPRHCVRESARLTVSARASGRC